MTTNHTENISAHMCEINCDKSAARKKHILNGFVSRGLPESVRNLQLLSVPQDW